MKTLFFILTLTLISLTASAGGIGNGGFILECRESGKAVYKVYDYEEFRSQGLTPQLGGPALTTEQRVEYVLKRLERVNPTRANKLRTYVKKFFADQEPLGKGENFIAVSDLGAAKKPSHCALQQIVQQRTEEQKPINMATFIVNKKLWNEIEKSGQTQVTAGIALHEAIYYEALNTTFERVENADGSGHITFNMSPAQVRYFNAFIASSKMETISNIQFLLAMNPPGKKPIIRIADLAGKPAFANRLEDAIFDMHKRPGISVKFTQFKNKATVKIPRGQMECVGWADFDIEEKPINCIGQGELEPRSRFLPQTVQIRGLENEGELGLIPNSTTFTLNSPISSDVIEKNQKVHSFRLSNSGRIASISFEPVKDPTGFFYSMGGVLLSSTEQVIGIMAGGTDRRYINIEGEKHEVIGYLGISSNGQLIDPRQAQSVIAPAAVFKDNNIFMTCLHFQGANVRHCNTAEGKLLKMAAE